MFIRVAKPSSATTYECTSYHTSWSDEGLKVLAHNRGEVVIEKVFTKDKVDGEWLKVFAMSDRGDTIETYTI